MVTFEAHDRVPLLNARRFRQLIVFLGMTIAALVVGGEGFTAEAPLIKPESAPWDSGNGFDFPTKLKKSRQSVSGIACPEPNANEPRLCLVVFDEGVEARYVTVKSNSYAVHGERVVLRASGGSSMLKRPQPTGITSTSRARILQSAAPARKTRKAGMSFGSRSTQQQVVQPVILPAIRTAPWFDIRTPTIFGRSWRNYPG
jgi:hypothetical protein